MHLLRRKCFQLPKRAARSRTLSYALGVPARDILDCLSPVFCSSLSIARREHVPIHWCYEASGCWRFFALGVEMACFLSRINSEVAHSGRVLACSMTKTSKRSLRDFMQTSDQKCSKYFCLEHFICLRVLCIH